MPVGTSARYVAAPSFAPSRFGLLSVAEQATDVDVHWRNGVEFQPDACEAAGTVLSACDAAMDPADPNEPVTGAPQTKVPTTVGIGTRGANPFTVYARIDCSLVGWSPSEFEDRSAAALNRGEGRAVEGAFWTGDVTGGTVSPHLAEDTEILAASPAGFEVELQSAASPVTTGAVGITEGLSRLEGALGACYGGEGVIHVPVSAVATLSAETLLVRDGPMLRTWAGNRVAVYASDPKVGPDGTVPPVSDAWLYATGAVKYWRSRITVQTVEESLNRSTNSMVLVPERTYVVGWDCCHFAAQVVLWTL